MIKVITIVGTRPEIIKMSRVIYELDKYVNHIIVHTGQNYDYELNQIFFDELKIRKPDYTLESCGNNATHTIANILINVDKIIDIEKPDAILIYGDTNSGLSVIAAKKRKIPIFHMEAGNRCFDQRVPEEVNRKIIDHLSDINIVISEHARRNLISEGIKPQTIIKSGSHLQEVLNFYRPNYINSNALIKLNIKSKEYFLISTHREEMIDNKDNLRELLKSLNEIAQRYKFQIIFSTHPRTRTILENLGDIELNPLIKFFKPFSFFDYIKLQMEAFCTISDSGTIFEEATLLNLPAITLRNSHERPEGMDGGTLIVSEINCNKILKSIEIIISQHDRTKQIMKSVSDYEGGPVSKQILRILTSYIDYVNRTVWNK